MAENVPNSTKIRFSATLTLHYSSHSETERLLMAPLAYSKTMNSDQKKKGWAIVSDCVILLLQDLFSPEFLRFNNMILLHGSFELLYSEFELNEDLLYLAYAGFQN